MSSTSTRSELIEKMRAAASQLNYEQLCKARDFVTALQKAQQMVADLKKSEEKELTCGCCEKCGSAKHETAAHNKVSAEEVEKRLMIARAILGE